MLKLSKLWRIAPKTELSLSVIHDPAYLKLCLGTLGSIEARKENLGISNDATQRLTSSIGNKDSFQNAKNNASPTGIVDEETGLIVGAEHLLDPVRYGDWEVNGMCYDF